MILPITYYGNPILRKKGEKIKTITPALRQLMDDMLETMRAYDGVGLAAQQVGKALQLAVIDVSLVEKRPSKMWIKKKEVDPKAHMPILLINPEISLIKTKEVDAEGCLSFPKIHADISRSKIVKVRTQTVDGGFFEFEAGGLLGRAVQHEFDHLQGVLFTDRMDPAERQELREEIEAIKLHPPAKA